MTRALRFASIGLLACFLPACSDDLQLLGPTPLDEGIIIYIHSGFVGSSQQLNSDVGDFDDVEGPCTESVEGDRPTWDDCISSIRVLPGWGATLYRDRDFSGPALAVTADVLDLRSLEGPCDESFNDCISSIRVFTR